jgi:hypothetical protein
MRKIVTIALSLVIISGFGCQQKKEKAEALEKQRETDSLFVQDAIANAKNASRSELEAAFEKADKYGWTIPNDVKVAYEKALIKARQDLADWIKENYGSWSGHSGKGYMNTKVTVSGSVLEFRSSGAQSLTKSQFEDDNIPEIAQKLGLEKVSIISTNSAFPYTYSWTFD